MFFNTTAKISNLDYTAFKSKLRAEKRPRLIDVSTQSEYRTLHIPGTRNVDVNGKTFNKEIKNWDKDKAYFIYCRDGTLSIKACETMINLGFKDVNNLKRGIKSWRGTLQRSY